MVHPRPSLQPFLDRLNSRSVLTAEEQQAVLDLPSHPDQVDANRDFVHLGQSVDHVSLIVDGLVGRFDQNSDGSRQITAIHIPGDMANLHATVQPQATSALQALSVAAILRVPHVPSGPQLLDILPLPRRFGGTAWSTRRSRHNGS